MAQTKKPQLYGASKVYEKLADFFQSSRNIDRKHAGRVALDFMRAFSGIELKIPDMEIQNADQN